MELFLDVGTDCNCTTGPGVCRVSRQKGRVKDPKIGVDEGTILGWWLGRMPPGSELHKGKDRDGGSRARPSTGVFVLFQAPAAVVSSDVNSEARLNWGLSEVDPAVDQGWPTGAGRALPSTQGAGKDGGPGNFQDSVQSSRPSQSRTAESMVLGFRVQQALEVLVFHKRNQD
ncbi:hypothetical protein CLCR_09166 [Cladophialophora carrionii]|uniref:Uncharacterized protein n=1 Tax=Cladophialophora carrionii TaxID=86049 RepID=A0A1C1CRH1_9EURO|nr:hypothetical protein CLCR_09166 [Cladophialophora carrionii]